MYVIIQYPVSFFGNRYLLSFFLDIVKTLKLSRWLSSTQHLFAHFLTVCWTFFLVSFSACRVFEFGRLMYWRCADRLSSITGIITVALESNQSHVLEVFFPIVSRAVLWMVLRTLSHFPNADFSSTFQAFSSIYY